MSLAGMKRKLSPLRVARMPEVVISSYGWGTALDSLGRMTSTPHTHRRCQNYLVSRMDDGSVLLRSILRSSDCGRYATELRGKCHSTHSFGVRLMVRSSIPLRLLSDGCIRA